MFNTWIYIYIYIYTYNRKVLYNKLICFMKVATYLRLLLSRHQATIKKKAYRRKRSSPLSRL